MKLLLEMLAMTSQCNMRCSYCDWQKDKFIAMDEVQFETACKHLEQVKDLINKEYSDIAIVQYSGGEPLLYPDILFHVLKLFKDKWIRINTNGVLITDEILEKVKEHGKTYIAVSLDGITYEPNKARFGENKQLFEKVLKNIDRIVEKKIPLMILCTLSKNNIDQFPEFIEKLSEKYEETINDGLLVMPTHAVTSYSKDNGAANEEQIMRFKSYIESAIDKYSILNNLSLHYKNLVSYLETQKRMYQCSVYDWSLSVHFRKNHLIEDGRFLSFGCGMRGVHELGLFSVEEDKEKQLLVEKVANYKKDYHEGECQVEGQVSEYNQLNERCENKCFPDWVIFDLVFSGQVSYEDAKKWFVLFRDPAMEEKYRNYRDRER